MPEERRQGYADLFNKLEEMHNEIKEIRVWMLGNGKLGLIAKVHILWCMTIFTVIGFSTLAIREAWKSFL